MTEDNPQNEDIFLEGDVVILRQPDIEKDVSSGHWHQWFNDQETTQYLVHGVFPLNKDQQAQIVQDEMDNPSSLLLVAIDKKTNKHIGVLCLKSINSMQRTAALSIVFGHRDIKGAALESVALLSKHGFDRLNLHRIDAGQNAALWSWMNSLELIGYQIDGYHQNAGVRNGAPYDVISYAITAERFYALQESRGGNICSPSLDQLYEEKSAENKTEKVKSFFEDLYSRDK